MPQDKSEIILSILSASIFLLLIVIASFLLFRIYLKKKNKLLLERERLKLEYEQTLFHSQLEIQEQIFTQISQEIHDNIGQVLSLARLNINTLGLPEERIAATDELLGRAIHDLRQLSHNLNTNYICETGLTGAIEQLLNGLQRTGHYTTRLDGAATDPVVSEEKAIILFRIVQEVINNIIRHAAASSIRVTIAGNDRAFSIAIADNGCGFDSSRVSPPSKGLGINNMRRRALMIDTNLLIESITGQGTTVTIQVRNPIQAK
ncbi:MAG TPA: ATP-binding protein [Chitinophagaceae bacterium]|nr:ATP-binding protein [Chitinophagaceae bacterium]